VCKINSKHDEFVVYYTAKTCDRKVFAERRHVARHDFTTVYLFIYIFIKKSTVAYNDKHSKLNITTLYDTKAVNF